MLVLTAQAIGDSSRIIEALERRYPKPALYPGRPRGARAGAELEDMFDEELGPNVRLLVVQPHAAERAPHAGCVLS